MSKNSGFTLLESLVALLMLSGILLLLSGLIQHANKMERAMGGYHQLEWEIFLLQLDNELSEVNYIGTTQTEISTEIEDKGRVVPLVIKKVNRRIIKRQSGGNQPLLTGVDQFVCQEKIMEWILSLPLLMGKRKKEHGSLNSQGGILLSVLLAIFLFSFLLMNMVTSYHQTVDLASRTEQLYQAKIAKELF